MGASGGECHVCSPAENPTPGDYRFVAMVAIGAGIVLPLFFAGRWAKEAMARAEKG
jgi:hypothetical protein